jgi:hypothetical protein
MKLFLMTNMSWYPEINLKPKIGLSPTNLHIVHLKVVLLAISTLSSTVLSLEAHLKHFFHNIDKNLLNILQNV